MQTENVIHPTTRRTSPWSRRSGVGSSSSGSDVRVTVSFTLLYVAVGLLLVEAVFGGLLVTMGASLLPGSSSSTGGGTSIPNGVARSFELKAFITGFVGVGGTIQGERDPPLEVGWGDTVTVTIVDGEAMMHNFHVDGANAQSRDLTGLNDTTSVTFRATAEGSFAYYCTIPGHRQSGMAGTLIVGEPSGPQIPPEAPTTVARIAQDPTAIPPLLTRNTTATVNLYLHAVEETAEIEPGVSYTYWTYNGTVPGPFFRVRVGDTVVVHFSNDATSTMNHSVDFHAVTGPGGGAAVTQTPPGDAKNFSFTALTPGLFVYHCGTPNIPTHIANGMFGMILVQPAGGMTPVDHEFYIMENELYLQWPLHTVGAQAFNGTALLDNEPTYVVFNGMFDGMTGAHALHVNVNDSVRIFFGEAGPNDFSAFHMIGSMFDRTYLYGDLTDPPAANLQTVPVPPGSTALMEYMAMYPGNYTLVDHQIANAIDKGALAVVTVSGWANSSIFHALAAPPALTSGLAPMGGAWVAREDAGT